MPIYECFNDLTPAAATNLAAIVETAPQDITQCANQPA